MKKYVILTLILSTALLIFGFVAVLVPSAQAITTTLPDTGIVGDNMLLDSYFLDLPSYSVSSSLSSIPSIPSWGYSSSGGTGNSLVIGSSGLIISRAATGWSNLRYVHNFVVVQTVTLSFFLSAATGDVTVHIRSSSNVDYYHHFTSLGLNSLTLSYDISLIQIYNTSQGSLTLSWFKLETGSYFTGFVPKDYENYGYDQGFVDGSEVYSSRSYSLTYSDVEPGAVPGPGNIRYTKGYIDFFNITSAADLANCSFSLIPAWFTYKNYEIISSGFILLSDSNNNVTGVLIYASPQASVTPSSSDVQIISYIEVFADYSLYVTIDPSLPSTVTPVLYPQVYSCSVNCQFGYSAFIDQMQSSYYNQGFTAGNASGYSDGFTIGRAEGYSAGLETAQNGNWFSLMSALVDIPIRSVTSLLSFDFLGFNMLNLLKLCITLFLFTFVLKILIGKLGS